MSKKSWLVARQVLMLAVKRPDISCAVAPLECEAANDPSCALVTPVSVFVPMLIKAVQELTAKVTALEAKVGA